MEREPNQEAESGSNAWAELASSAPEFAGAPVTEEMKAEIFDGKELFGADEVDFCKDSEKMDALLEDMKDWKNITIFHGRILTRDSNSNALTPGITVDEVRAGRLQVVRKMVGYIADVYGVKDCPEVEVSNTSLADAGYVRDGNKIRLGPTSLDIDSSPEPMLSILAHEMMHCYDDTVASQEPTELATMLKYNADNYFSDGIEDYDRYERQLSERRAFARERVVMAQYKQYKDAHEV